MNLKAIVGAAATLVVLAFNADPAFANRTFVSGKGNDTGTCALTNPCRSFAYAVTQTTASGEIMVLDSAPYGAFTITQPVSISSTGAEAAISVPSGGTGITINAPGARVDLRGLTVDGQGVGATGIDIVAAQHVNIVNVAVRNWTSAGIAVRAGQAVISNAFISNASTGVNLASSLCCSLIEGSTITDNGIYGVYADNTTAASRNLISDEIKNTSIFDNTIGIDTYFVNLLLSHVDCYGNSSEDISNNDGAIDLSSSVVGTIQNNSIEIESYGNNSVSGTIGGSVQQRPLQ